MRPTPRLIGLAALAVIAVILAGREIDARPGARARDALALYAPTVRLGERSRDLIARQPSLTLAAYEGWRDSAFTSRDGFADLYLLADGMDGNYSERPPAPRARIRGLKLRTTSRDGAAAAQRRLVDRLGAPRVRCWGQGRSASTVLSWPDPVGSGGVALSVPDTWPPVVADTSRAARVSDPLAMLLVAANGLARELRYSRACPPGHALPPT